MGLRPQPASARHVETVNIGPVQMGSLGRVVSARGVEVIAIDGMPNNKVENHLTTNFRTLSCLQRIPGDGMMSVDRRPARPLRPLNYTGAGVSLATRGTGRFMGALCIFSPGFLSDLQEIDSRLRFDGIDFLTSIESERLSYLGRTMFREAVQPGFASSLFVEAIGMSIALEIARYDGAVRLNEGYRGGLAPWQIRRLESYVHDHLSEQLTLNELARLVGISVRHLSRTVREAKGVSVHRWIAECRLSEARRLLANSELPVHEIAQRSAFQSAAAFSTAFRAASGFTPSEFRRLTLR